MIQTWTTDELKHLAENLNLSTKEIYLKYCDEYGSGTRSYDSVQKKVKKLRDAYGDEPDEVDLQDVGKKIDELLATIPSQELLIPDQLAVKKREIKEAAKWWLDGIIESSKNIIFPPHQTVQGDGTTLCVLISDVHVGKFNEHFNLQIAKERILSVPNLILSQEDVKNVDEVLIMLAGDIIEGEDIFPTQAHHIECSVISQIEAAVESLWNMILHFRKKYKCKIRVETVPGNHGRMSKTAHERTNWDNVVYHVLRILSTTHNDSEIIINANFDTFHTFQVKDKVGLLYHHGVKHTGTPAMREKIAGWSNRKKFDYLAHGHWHEWHVGNWLGKIIVCNGCMCGPDDLAELLAKEDTARQAYFFISPGLPLHGFGVIEWPG